MRVGQALYANLHITLEISVGLSLASVCETTSAFADVSYLIADVEAFFLV